MANLHERARALSAQVAAFGRTQPKKKEKKAYTHPSFAYKSLGARQVPWQPKKQEIKKKVVSTKSPYQYEALKIKDGRTPVKGIDYFTSQEVEQMKQEMLAILSVDVKQPDKQEIIDAVLELIKDKKLSINDLADAESFQMRTRDGLMTRYKFEELMHGAGTSSGSGYQVPTSGTVDGSNTVFVWATAPNVIVLDNGNAMNKVSSDGTVNWTGTTTTTLTQAPNYNIYATA